MKNDKDGQAEASAVTVNHLIDFGVKYGDQLSLEFFFYTEEHDNAVRLAEMLQKDYGYEIYQIHNTDDKWSVIGLTNPLPILTEMIQEWAKEMCKLGDKFNCRFDGWGTLV